MQFDWTISIAGLVALAGFTLGAVGAAYGLVARICNRLEGIEQQGALLSQRMGQHATETGRRLDNIEHQVAEVRSVLLSRPGEGR